MSVFYCCQAALLTKLTHSSYMNLSRTGTKEQKTGTRLDSFVGIELMASEESTEKVSTSIYF